MDLKDVEIKIREGLHNSEILSTEKSYAWETFITQNYVIQTPKTGEEHRMSKNNFLYRYLSENDIPVPKIYLESEGTPVYSVYERFNGVKMQNIGRNNPKSMYLSGLESAGSTLANIHNVKGFGYGEPCPEDGYRGSSHDSWREFLESKVDEVEEYVIHEPFQEIVEQGIDKLDMREVPERPEISVLHNDYQLDNIILDSSLKAQVIDLDNAYYGDADFDFVKSENLLCVDEESRKAFRKGYTKNRENQGIEDNSDNYLCITLLQSADAGERVRRSGQDIDLDSWAKTLESKLEEI